MRTLKFVVNAQKISPDPNRDFSGIAPGTSGYLKAQFSFSAEWSGLVKVAEFRKYLRDEPVSVPIINGECTVPDTLETVAQPESGIRSAVGTAYRGT